MPARRGAKPHIPTVEILLAVHQLGTRWPLLFTDWEVTQVNEALDRELLAGTLASAHAVSARGVELLRAEGHQPELAPRLEVRSDLACPQCRLTQTCWVVSCAGCGQVTCRHAHEGDLTAAIQTALAGHACALARAGATQESASVG